MPACLRQQDHDAAAIAGRTGPDQQAAPGKPTNRAAQRRLGERDSRQQLAQAQSGRAGLVKAQQELELVDRQAALSREGGCQQPGYPSVRGR
jgi:hypothetical protein